MFSPFSIGRAGWFVVAIAVVVAYLYPAPYFNNLNNPNENVRVYMTRSIVEHGTFAIDEVIDEWGYVNDKATHDGRMYPGKAPGVSLLGVPTYFVHHRLNTALERTPSKREIVWVCRLGGTIVPLLLFYLFVAAFSVRVVTDPGTRQIFIVALALGSTMLPYGVIFASHSTMAAALFSAYLLIHRHVEAPRDAWPPVAIGVLLGTAVLLEYPAALGAAVIGLYAIFRSPTRSRFVALSAAGVVAPIGLLLYYHHAAFGGPLQTPYSHLENPEFVEHVSGGFFGMERIRGNALHGSFFAPGNGLFWFLPWTMMSVVGLVFALHFERLREPAAVTLAVAIVYSIFISMVDNWRGGWTAGPRYIVAVVPFLAWYLLLFLAEIRRTGLGVPTLAATMMLVGASVFSCGVSAAVFPHYPPEIENPIFEISIYLLQRGFVPHNLGQWLGWAGPTSLAPVFALEALAVVVPALLVYGLDSLERATLATVVVAGATGFLALQSPPTTTSDADVGASRLFIADVWEPRRETEHVLLRDQRLPSALTYGRATDEELRATARAAARIGHDDTAIELYAAARRQQALRPPLPDAIATTEDSPDQALSDE